MDPVGFSTMTTYCFFIAHGWPSLIVHAPMAHKSTTPVMQSARDLRAWISGICWLGEDRGRHRMHALPLAANTVIKLTVAEVRRRSF
eukprot:4137668-Amphidinium_carterae.1